LASSPLNDPVTGGIEDHGERGAADEHQEQVANRERLGKRQRNRPLPVEIGGAVNKVEPRDRHRRKGGIRLRCGVH
jgi:hypothetical protein